MTHLTTYDAGVETAYSQLITDVKRLRSEGLDSVTYYAAMRTVTGQCGARCGAAAKRLKRAIVLEALVSARDSGLDITPTAAQHSVERLIGRGVDSRATLASFATPGRTAADKSQICADDLADLELRLQAELETLGLQMTAIKDLHAQRYKAAVASDD